MHLFQFVVLFSGRSSGYLPGWITRRREVEEATHFQDGRTTPVKTESFKK